MNCNKRDFNWYFGWNIVIAASFLTLLTSGLRMSIGTFFLPIANDLHFSRSLLATIIAIGMLFYGIAMPIAGYLVGRFGTKLVLMLGTLIIIISAIWTVLSKDPWNFLFSFGIALSFGTAFVSSVSFTQIISRWFTRKRGMALFLLTTGSMAGIAIMMPVFTLSISYFGWQSTLLGFTVFFTIIAIPIALFIIRDNAPDQTDTLSSTTQYKTKFINQPKTELALKEVFKTLPFWQLCIGLFACGFSMNLLGTHGIPMLIDHGFTAMVSSFGIGLIGLVAIFSTLILGKLSDIIQRKYILTAIYLVRGLGFIALMLVMTQWQLFIVAIIGGFVWAGSVSLSSAITADIYGVKLVGVLSGLTYLMHQIGAMISSWLGGWAYENFTTHWIAFGAASLFLLIAAIVSSQLPKQEKFRL